MITLSAKWAPGLTSKPETGMGYQVVSVVLKDGRRYEQVVVIGGQITQIRGIKVIPFVEDEIAQIVVTHDKWDFNAEQ
ncbi:MAG: hypothetical protein WAN11_20395 [Syntrophobacteraceae bacterium]